MARYPKYLHRCNATSWEEGICISCEIGLKQKNVSNGKNVCFTKFP